MFLLAVAVHAVVAWQYAADPLAAHPIADAQAYHEWAERIIRDGLAAEPVFHQSPLFPVVLAAVYAVVGEARYDVAGLVLCALLGAAAVASLVPLGRLAFGCLRAGLAAALLALLHGAFAYYSLKLLPVSLALATQALALVLLTAARRDRATWKVAAAGVAWGLATLARAENLLFLPFAAATLCLGAPIAGKVSRKVAVGILIVAWLATVAPATLHNARHGDFVPIASGGGENLFIGNQRGASGGYMELAPGAGNIFTQPRAARVLAEQATGRAMRPSEVSAWWGRRALAEVAAGPAGWLALEGRKLARILHPGDPTDLYSLALERELYMPVLWLLPLGSWSLILLGGGGVACVVRERRDAAWPLAALVGLHVVLLMAFFVDSRLRLPLLFFLTPFGGFAVVRAVDAWRAGRNQRPLTLLAAVFVLATLAGLAATRPTPRDRTRLASVLSLEQRLDEALAILAPELARAEPDAVVLDHAGWLHQKRGDWTVARQFYLRALESGGLVPERARQCRTRLGQVLEQLGDLAGARAQHDAAVASGLADAGTYYERGVFLLRRGETAAAVRDLETAIRLDPGWPEPRAVLERLRRGGG